MDDNLPLVTAQATLASAQSNLVESLYQYNLAKLALARSAGSARTAVPGLSGEVGSKIRRANYSLAT